MLTATDASLLDEWERLAGRAPVERETRHAPTVPVGPPPAWRTTVRTAAFGHVELFARGAFGLLSERTGWPLESLVRLGRAYREAHPEPPRTDAEARSAAFYTLTEEPGRWVVHQRFADPDGDNDWGFIASVDLAAALDDGGPTLVLDSIGSFGEETTRPVVTR